MSGRPCRSQMISPMELLSVSYATASAVNCTPAQERH